MTIDSPVEAIPGVGPVSARTLAEHGIQTAGDVVRTVPIRYIDFTHPRPISSISKGLVSVRGAMEEIHLERTKRKFMTLIRARIKDETGMLHVVWFNQSYLMKVLQPGKLVHLHGPVVVDQKLGRVLRNPSISFQDRPLPEPHYSLRTGITSGRFAKLVNVCLTLTNSLDDPLDQAILQKYDLPTLADSLRLAHKPDSMGDVSRARERLALDELWTVILMALLAKQATVQDNGYLLSIYNTAMERDIGKLPFDLTDDQSRAITDIIKDLQKPTPMRRLLNGDVGSGKTVVAMLVSKQVLLNKLHAVFLSPTTVLARQHYETWRKFFPQSSHFLFTSGLCMYNGERVTRKTAIENLETSPASFISGTHAVFHEDLGLHDRVGLLVVDEQHRFGVMQRAHILTSQHNKAPHLLSMSATPIPRTAALVLYGDLDISVLSYKPKMRKTVVTKLASELSRPYVYAFVDQLLQKGEQAFVVCPTIGSESEESFAEEAQDPVLRLDLFEERKAVMQEYQRLEGSIFAHRRIGLLHGRMKQAEKDEVLEQFRNGKLDILVSTTVIEVGVDIPNATVMIVEDAEFFGLAQLHQLRGRVGRGERQSYCFLFARAWSPQVKTRLSYMTRFEDGFRLAEKDLELRGPGELYGTVQAGFKPFQYASLGDMGLVSKARNIAEDIVQIPQNKWPLARVRWLDERAQHVHIE